MPLGLALTVEGKSLRKLVMVFGRKTVRFAEAGKRNVKLELSKKGRRTLSRLDRARLVIAGKATDATGEAKRVRAGLTVRR